MLYYSRTNQHRKSVLRFVRWRFPPTVRNIPEERSDIFPPSLACLSPNSIGHLLPPQVALFFWTLCVALNHSTTTTNPSPARMIIGSGRSTQPPSPTVAVAQEAEAFAGADVELEDGYLLALRNAFKMEAVDAPSTFNGFPFFFVEGLHVIRPRGHVRVAAHRTALGVGQRVTNPRGVQTGLRQVCFLDVATYGLHTKPGCQRKRTHGLRGRR